MANQALINQATRNQVYLERLKAAEFETADELLRKVDASIRQQLASVDLQDYKRAQLEALLKSVDGELQALYDDFGKTLDKSFGEIAQTVALNEVEMLNHIAPDGVSFVDPTPARLIAAVKTTPLSVKGYDGGKLLGPFIDDMGKSQRDMLTGAIRQGYFQGQSNSQIIKTIRGTKANNYADGLLAVSKRDAEAIISTAIQHVATSARSALYAENADLITGEEIVATLDNKTTQQCRSLDGVVFPLGKGPRPPFHIRCRTTTVPVLDSKYDWLDEGATRAAKGPDGKTKNIVPANKTYYDWLKTQPADFQDDALGPTLGKLFRDGGLSADEFARLNLGRSFQPLTIAEMREKDPLAFARAGLSGKTIDKPPAARQVPKKPEPKVDAKKPPAFTPAKTTGEIVQRLNALGIKNVDIGKAKLDVQNTLLRNLEAEASFAPLDMLSLQIVRLPSKKWAAMWSNNIKQLTYNLAYHKKIDVGEVISYEEKIKKHEANIAGYNDYLKDPAYSNSHRKIRRYIFESEDAIRDLKRRIADGEVSRPYTIESETVGDSTMTHELGHSRHYQFWEGRENFSFTKKGSVSEYGRTNHKEYFAEWFVQYRLFGPDGVPSDLLKLFEGIK